MIHAATTFVAVRYDLLQSLHAWTTGDFSARCAAATSCCGSAWARLLAAYLAADRYTVAGMGREFAANLGLNHARLMLAGLLIVAISAVVVVTAGSIPFLGLIVPNAVSLLLGDNMRRAIPWVAILGGVSCAGLRHRRPAADPSV